MGLAAHVLFHRIPAKADPLGPDNVLGFVSGLLTGTGSLFTGRWMVTGKSPLTNGWGEANCGGNFSPAIKRCGVDGIFFKGISPEPVYLYVDDKTAELRDAADIWGKDAVETESILIDSSESRNTRVACIGQAGEKLSLISGVSTDKGRMAARSGLGAVMGSKKLKALVLAGTQRIHAHNPNEIKQLSRICNKWVQFQPPFLPGILMAFVGALLRIMPWGVAQDGFLYKISLRKWGTVCMNQDVESIFYFNELLNRAGMDSISAGHAVAFAFECFEKGILTTAETEGKELKWGDPDAVKYLIEQMIERKGIGDILADGVKLAAERIGNDSDQLAMHAGGQEPAMHDSRNDPGFALHYSVEPAPGRHTNGAWFYYEMYQLWKTVKNVPRVSYFFIKSSKYKKDINHAKKSKANSEYLNVMNGSGICQFGSFLGSRRIRIFEWLNAATGWHFSPEQYMEIGNNVQQLKHAFNIKHGILPRDNKACDRLLGIPVQTKGANKGCQVDIDVLMEDYWQLFGWDKETGVPCEKTIDKIASIS